MKSLSRFSAKKALMSALLPAVLGLSMFLYPSSSRAVEPPEEAPPEERELDFEFMEEQWRQIDEEVQEYFPTLHWRNVFNWLRHDEEGKLFDVGELFNGLARLFLGEIMVNFRFMGKLLVLAVAAAFLKNLQASFESQSVATISQGVVFLAMVGLVLPGFTAAVNMARGVIEGMVDFSMALIPLLVVLLASLGSFSAAAIFHPVIISSVYIFSTLVRNIVFPLILFGAALALVNHFSPHLRLGQLADFLKDLCVWGLGLLMTLFVGIITLQGVAGTVSDAIALRTAKYLTGTFIPVVGKMLADSVETVAGTSLLLKNAAGLAGLVLLALTILFPMVKLLALVIIYKVSAALVQIVGETSLGECLNTMGNCYTMVLASLSAVSLLFFLSVVIIVGSGNALLMLR